MAWHYQRVPPESTVPAVSYIMPVLNEIDYLEAALEGIRAQDFAGEIEIVLALGPSDDGTNDLAERIADADARIRLVANPTADIPVGLNAAIALSRAPIVVRVDAHSELPPNYTRLAIAALERTGAMNVGGVMMARGRSRFQRAVARAYVSRFGLGGASYHYRAAEGPAESAYLGVFRREVFDLVGGFDESLRRGEDWELNLRIRSAGYLVWYDPALEVTYWPRRSWSELAQQFVATGTWRGDLVRRLGVARNSLRYFAPPLLVLAFVVSLVWTLMAVLINGLPLLPALLFSAAPALYVLALIAVAIKQRGIGVLDRAVLVLVFITMHLAWGLGFWRGLLFGARATVDRSRVRAGR